MNAPRDVSYDDYLSASLTDPAEAAAYLDAVMELEDAPALLMALRQVAKAHGMAEVARRADVGDKTLFRALSETGNVRARSFLHRFEIVFAQTGTAKKPLLKGGL